jgi:hypothetical protein
MGGVVLSMFTSIAAAVIFAVRRAADNRAVGALQHGRGTRKPRWATSAGDPDPSDDEGQGFFTLAFRRWTFCATSAGLGRPRWPRRR